MASPYLIGIYSTKPETITKAIKPTDTIRTLRRVLDGRRRFGFLGAAAIPFVFDEVSA
jgi:hypothetical protein